MGSLDCVVRGPGQQCCSVGILGKLRLDKFPAFAYTSPPACMCAGVCAPYACCAHTLLVASLQHFTWHRFLAMLFGAIVLYVTAAWPPLRRLMAGVQAGPPTPNPQAAAGEPGTPAVRQQQRCAGRALCSLLSVCVCVCVCACVCAARFPLWLPRALVLWTCSQPSPLSCLETFWVSSCLMTSAATLFPMTKWHVWRK